MAQFSCVPAAIKNEGSLFIFGQITLHFIKSAVRYGDGAGDMALVIFGPFGAGINDDHGRFGISLFF